MNNKWLNKTQNIFTEFGRKDLLDSKSKLNPRVVCTALRYHLKNEYKVDWKHKLSNLSKCDTYSLYKVLFEQEKYL